MYRVGGAGGAERMACWLAGALAGAGHPVRLVTLDAPGVAPFYDHGDAVLDQLSHDASPAGKLRRVWRLVRLFRAHGIRVLVGFLAGSDKTVLLAARLAGVRAIAAERNSPAMYHLRHGRAARMMAFLQLRCFDHVTVQFPEFIDKYPAFLRSGISAIGNPVFPAADSRRHHDGGRRVLLSLGRIDEIQKRLSVLVDAFRRIAPTFHAWDLKIVGSGPDRARLEAQIASLGLADRIVLEPETADPAPLFGAADLFVIPSLWEGFPNALAESMAHGLPAVGFAGADGVAHLIDDGESGWLAPGADDPEALAATLAAAMGDETERRRRGESARRAMAAFAPARQLAAWRDLVTAVAEGRRPAAAARR